MEAIEIEKRPEREDMDEDSGGRGNTALQGRNWCFTLNNPESQLDFDSPGIPWLSYAVWQAEMGDRGTYHFQGYMHFSRPVRLSGILKANNEMLKGSHLEIARGSHEDNEKYCTKEASRLEGPWRWGEKPKQGKVLGELRYNPHYRFMTAQEHKEESEARHFTIMNLPWVILHGHDQYNWISARDLKRARREDIDRTSM